jgi:hypothetical protein
MIANDVTVQSGSFGVLEDDFFFKASVYARERGAWNTKNPTDNLHHITPPDPFHRLNIAILVTITASLLPLYPSTLTHSVSSSCLFEYDAYIGIPRVFISCNSGARIGLVDELKPKFRVSDDFHEMIRMSILLHLITSLDTRIVWTLPLSFCPAPLTLPSFPSPSFLPYPSIPFLTLFSCIFRWLGKKKATLPSASTTSTSPKKTTTLYLRVPWMPWPC